ncbi:hypothetical protein ACFXOY_31130 [Streptomyces niveus]|uniref:hypothetical protein n=1 Tax=Streptomyces niveus TaxID=193462 RepID=UPI00368211B6
MPDLLNLPASIPTVVVHGRYLGPDGRTLGGTVTFSAPALLTFPDADVFVAGPVVAQLDENGHFEVRLPATDAPNMQPSGWSYIVKENLAGVVGGRTFSVLLPKAVTDVDLADVAPADPTTPNYVPVAGSQIFTGTAAPASALGRDGDFFTQYDTRTLLGITSTTVTMWTRAAGVWVKVGDAIRGAAWYVSTTSTPSTDTKPGDFLLRSDTGDVWQRGASGWGNPVASLKGPKGDTGATGTTGAQGVKGDTGAASTVAGPKGDKGDVGATGATGATGSQGPKGDQGEPGKDGTGAGTVSAVNGVQPNGAGNVTLLPSDVGSIPVADKGVANGVATLDGTGKVPAGQLSIPSGVVTTVNGKGGPTVTLAAADVSALAASTRGAVNGVASLDASGDVPIAQIPNVARNTWTPQALGFAAWSVDPAGIANPAAKAAVVKRLYMAGINITEPTPVNAVVIFARGWAGSTAVPAARFLAGIYNEAGSRVGASATISSLPAPGADSAPGAKSNHIGAVPLKLSATVTLQPGRYWAAFLMSAGAATDFYYMHTQNEAPSAPANFHLGDVFHRAWAAAGDAFTTLPTTVNQLTGEVGIDPAVMALAVVA